LIKENRINFENLEKEIAQNLQPQSQVLKNKLLYLKTTVESNIIKARNVLGMIEGENPNEVIVVGAHYDHVGMNMGYIWNGSDDNASGTVGMLTLAKAFAASGIKPQRTIIFAAWTGEEEGLLGSEYFVNNFTKNKKIVLNLNYDMISRDSEDDTLGIECEMTLTQIDTTAPFIKLTDKFNEELALGLKINYDASEKPGGGSDHASFSEKGIPIFYLMAGWPDEYHRPSDHPDLANIEKMTKIIKLGYNLIWHYANSSTPIKP
jgi:Zn-dependent M28 family amino/carboxypeptidase